MTKILTLDADKLIDALRQRLYLHLEGAECPTIVKEVKTIIVKCAIAPAESAERVVHEIIEQYCTVEGAYNYESGAALIASYTAAQTAELERTMRLTSDTHKEEIEYLKAEVESLKEQIVILKDDIESLKNKDPF